MIRRNWLRIGDTVEIDDQAAFPISNGRIGKVIRRTDTGMFTVEFENGEETVVYRDEVRILEEEAI